ncbi:unnamed protein product [Zymoseptoria tritici ST99CH_3D1]|nr:unnamed protein product [Zymoseptoria tritici ST99CH_3D1]
METITATAYSTAPKRAQPTTRTVQPAVTESSHHQPHNHHIADNSNTTTTSPSLSQDSYISGYSSHNENTPKLHSSHSNLSQLTNNTDLTEPDISSQESQPSKISRERTPDNGQHTTGDFALASPMSIASPVAPTINGSKRTASGHVKSAASLSTPSSMFPPTSTRSRRESTASSAGSRAGELAASLKERLGYAMAKVQHGWEHKSLNEVEQLAASRERNNRTANRYSASYLDGRPQTSGLSGTTANMSINEGMYAEEPYCSTTSPPAKRRSGHYNFSFPMTSTANSYEQPPHLSAPRLDPAPDLSPVSHTASHHRKPSNAYTATSSAMSPPRTPVAGGGRERPTTLRTQTQTMEAERDAIMVLSQLGSPRTVRREDSGGSLVSAGR